MKILVGLVVIADTAALCSGKGRSKVNYVVSVSKRKTANEKKKYRK
jgi:hypothetical protein